MADKLVSLSITYLRKSVHKINNSNIYISVDSFGAELRSVCDVHGEEYLLQDRSCWGAQAPILFPIVGKPKDGKYKIEGKTYEIGNHGFARECNFKVLEKRSDAISFSLRESAETSSFRYPSSSRENPFASALKLKTWMKSRCLLPSAGIPAL